MRRPGLAEDMQADVIEEAAPSREGPDSLVGRRAEIATIERLLAAARLVTLSGAGGVGKTRLASHFAQQPQSAYPDGVWMASLAELTQSSLIRSTVAVSVRGAGQARDDLPSVIGQKRALLVLDNCEHLVEACASLCSDLLRSCPALTILATSQEPLRVPGEVVYNVPPLSLDDASSHPGLGPAHSDAVTLFLQRAAASNPTAQFSDEDLRLITSMCHRLDGLPLSIELAAAASRALPLATLEAMSSHPHEMDLGAFRTAPDRHRSVRSVLDYSYARCDQPTQDMWQAFAVFRGGADLAALRTVGEALGLAETQVHTTLLTLIDRSVLTFDGRRYRMLETLRSYGDEHLRASGRQNELQAAHHRHYFGTAIELSEGWFGPDQPALLAQATEELPNLRAALEHTMRDSACIDSGLGMASALWPLWIGTATLAEGRHWLDSLLALADQPSPEHQAAIWVSGLVRATAGEPASQNAMLVGCREIAETTDSDAVAARCTQVLGLAELLDGRTETAIDLLEDAVALERQIDGFNPYLTFGLVNLGAALCFGKQTSRALEVLGEARRLCREHGEQLLLSWAEVYTGLAALLEGRASAALSPLTDALGRKRALQDRLGLTFVLELFAWAAIAHGDAVRAGHLIGAVEELSEPLGAHLAGLQRMLEWHDEHVEQAQVALGADAYAAATRAGRAMSADDAIEFALGDSRHHHAPDARLPLPLTPREHEIGQLVAQGLTNKEVAAQLVISPRTVSTHVEHILAKLKLRSRAQIAVACAAELTSDTS